MCSRQARCTISLQFTQPQYPPFLFHQRCILIQCTFFIFIFKPSDRALQYRPSLSLFPTTRAFSMEGSRLGLVDGSRWLARSLGATTRTSQFQLRLQSVNIGAPVANRS
ncbi:hypothetical protein KQX54_014684 [Cotesia glomerata]|uniref:Uncharacterized protein n=1 Tax=Cotesia glomerata TaxID=32391 RepID=A0AAV7IPW6_COTGL|nr:hypothetical protein KQX54_014684 [Cotesia glomerata]